MEAYPDIELFNDGYWVTGIEGVRGDSIETSTVTRAYIEGPFDNIIDAKAAKEEKGY